ncbi:MAG: hypothetical protein JXR36_01230 [Bacteroidales bacterium]|nr:hypothetical protein [Bacteroidales bacterium]
MRRIVIILITLVVGYISYKAMQLLKWYDALGVGFTGKPNALRDGNLILKCQAKLDNPKDFEITVTKPTIRIYNKGVVIGASEPTREKVTIAANAITVIDYEIKVPVQGQFMQLLLSSGASIYNQVMSGNVANLSLGLNLDVIAYMQIYGIEREWKQKLTV